MLPKTDPQFNTVLHLICYSCVSLISGGLLEVPYNGGLVGRVFNKIIGQQFFNVKFGDRFFFTHKVRPKERQ